MDKENIEKMAKVIKFCKNTSIDECHTKVDCHHCIAEQIYNEGYRKQEWISVEDRLPKAEEEVLVLAIRKTKWMKQAVPIITTAMYEDGTVSTDDSDWSWYDMDYIYDEENDVQYIPEGWWEYRHYNPDDVLNNPIDDTVTHWMPIPVLPKMKG